MPLSSELADSVMEVLADAAQGDFFDPEMEAARPMLETQAQLSRIPTPRTLLIESLASREGQHLFLYPFAGRNAHIGLGSLLAWRLSKRPAEHLLDRHQRLRARAPLAPTRSIRRRSSDQSLFEEGDLLHDVLASLNSSELARRRFREIARVSGLISQGFPGQPKSSAPAAGVELALLRGVSQVRRRQQAARPSRERGAEPGARHQAAARGPAAHARAEAWCSSSSRCPARSRCR